MQTHYCLQITIQYRYLELVVCLSDVAHRKMAAAVLIESHRKTPDPVEEDSAEHANPIAAE
jgi:hypothetical protein